MAKSQHFNQFTMAIVLNYSKYDSLSAKLLFVYLITDICVLTSNEQFYEDFLL